MTSHMLPDLVAQAEPRDERLWVPQAENVWFRPLLLNRVNGEWVNLLRVRKSGVLSRHRHPAPVHGYVIRGAWRYLEHNWVAEAGSYVFEPPGEVHTLVTDDGVGEMVTLFHVSGALIYVDEQGQSVRLRRRPHQNRNVPQALRSSRIRRRFCRPVRAVTSRAITRASRPVAA